MFKDRIEAGEKLAQELAMYADGNSIILGIPRGGAIVAYNAAKILNIPWDIIIPRKIGSPFNSEIAIGAVTQDGYTLLNNKVVKYYQISDDYIRQEAKEQINEIKRRMDIYRGKRDFPGVSGKNVILIDDGIATGFTIIAAINSIKRYNINRIIVAVPVAPVNVLTMLASQCDGVVCIETPGHFTGVGNSYKDFNQNTDEEIISLFKQHNGKKFV